MKPLWKAVLGVLGVTLPAVFTFLASRAESNEAKIRAEVAYVTLQDSVKELQEASYDQALELAEIRGQLKAERREHAKALPNRAPASRPIPLDSDGVDDLADSTPQVQVKMRPPPDFAKAVNDFKAKK